VLPRNDKTHKDNNRKSIFFIVLFLFFFFLMPSAWAENVLVKFYQEHISAVDGNRCPMYPSCSVYASRAIEKHGSVLGWVMACDRLVRCGRDEVYQSRPIIIKGRKSVYDPVSANDFWWFEKEKKQ